MAEMISANIIIGNLCSLLAMGTDTLSGAQKTTKRMLWVQNISQTFYCIGAAALHGYSGAVQNVVSILRNFAGIKKIESKLITWALVVLGVVLGIVCNNLGWVGLLPVIANLQYSLVVFCLRGNERALKVSFLVSALMFSIFSFVILNFVGVITNLVVAVSTGIFLLKQRKKNTV